MPIKDYYMVRQRLSNHKLEGIQTLRAIAFLEIFLGHCGVSICSATFGVSIFMILSGFCMAINYLPKAEKLPILPIGSVKFAISKVKKLYVLHLLMLAAIYVIVKMPTTGEAIPRLIREFFLVKCWKTHSEDYFAYNGVTWYLSTYLFVCIGAPYVIRLVSKIKKQKMVCLFAGAIYIFMVAIGYGLTRYTIPIGDDFARWFTYICPVYRVLDFTLGVLLGWIFLTYQEKECLWRANVLELLAVIVFVATEVVFIPMEKWSTGLCYNAFFVPASLLIVWVFARNAGLITNALKRKWLIAIGNISALTFVIHQVVIRGMNMYVYRLVSVELSLAVKVIINLLLTVGIAYSYLYFQNKKHSACS